MKNTIEDYIRQNEDFRQILLKQKGGIMKFLAEYLPEHPETYVDIELLAKYREQYYESFLKENIGNYEVTFLEENEKKRKSFGYIHLSKELEYQITLTPVLTRISKDIAEEVRDFIYKYMVFAWKENRRLYYPDGTPSDILYNEIINLYSVGGKACICMDYLLKEHHNPQVWATKKNVDSLYNEFLIQQYSDYISKDELYKKLRQAVKDMTAGKSKEECRQIAVNTMMAVKNFSRMIYSTSKIKISDCTGDYVADKEWLHNIAKDGILRSINHKKASLYSCFSFFVLMLNEIGRIWAARLLVNDIDMHELEKETGCILFPVSEPTEWPDGRNHENYRYYVDKDIYTLDNGYCIGNEEKAKELLDNLKENNKIQKMTKGSNNRESLAIRLKDSIPEFIDKLNNNPESITKLGTLIVMSKFDWSLMEAIIRGLSEKWLMDKAIQVITDTWDEHVARKDDICYNIKYTEDYSLEKGGISKVNKPLIKIPKFLDIEKSLSEIKESELNRREVNSMYEKRIEEKENNNNQVVTDLEKVSKEIKNASCPWDDSMDYIFNKKVKPQEIEKALKNAIPNSKLKGRPQHYVSYRILKELKYISSDTTEKDYLRWINLHFNYGWSNDDALKFRMNNKKEFDNLHPSKWKSINTKSNIEKQYYNYAIILKNTFTKTLEHGKEVDNSELFEHLKDRPRFLSNAYEVDNDKYFVKDEDYINNGK